MTGDSQSDRSPPRPKAGLRPAPAGRSFLCYFLFLPVSYVAWVQKLRRVKLTAGAYVGEQFHKRMRPPEECPNCGRLHRLWAHGYYGRWTTDELGKALRLALVENQPSEFAKMKDLFEKLDLQRAIQQKHGVQDPRGHLIEAVETTARLWVSANREERG